ncbi:protein IQ-DOMAIN 14 [Punica granatum]|nr:protein IQ-DOMAIN 14 [Punica granatum]XP_031391219.1 protein IQ-DOMAIN 14 [Punica granatum]XP_031391220.1 protein IQ-DOMAIN 14 [Punica granatum]PKI69809.1 hypothetical protein CRG98_009684 [Punica granatum]
MGKKGSWFAAIKKVFVSHSKDKPVNESEEKKDRKKNKGNAKLRQGERKSFIPLFREPSSIEKILGDAEREHNIIFRPPLVSTSPPVEQPKTPSFVPPPPPALPREPSPRPASPRAASSREPSQRVASPRAPSPRAASPRAASPKAPSPRVVNHQREFSYRPEPTLRNHHASATKIQAAYRGYMARRSFRALRGLVRLQGVVRGQNVKRQTMNAMKYMQLLVRVQSQIQSRRIQMLENQARQQAQNKEVESNLGKWSLAPEAGNDEHWDDSLLTKEEVEVRLQRKVEAVIKRERAMAYAYSHQLWKSNPKSAQTPLMNMHAGGYPWWWNWLERQLPQSNTPETQMQTPKSYRLTPMRSNSELKPSPRPTSSSANKQPSFGFDNIDSAGTPRSTRSSVPISSSKVARTPPSSRMVPPSPGTSGSNKLRIRATGRESPFGMKDDDSLASCPPFSVPSYMAPTVSAKAKVRANSNPRDRFPGTPSEESSRRGSFPLTQGIRSFKWNKGSIFSGSRDSPSSQRGNGLDKHQTLDSTGNLSVDSTVSLPAGAIGRKPFNRFV